MWQRGFLELGDELWAAFDKFDEAFFRSWKEDIELLDVRVETKLLEFSGDPFGVVFVVWRTDMVRARREAVDVSAEVFPGRNGAEVLFPPAFDAGRVGGGGRRTLPRGGVLGRQKNHTVF